MSTQKRKPLGVAHPTVVPENFEQRTDGDETA
ncbi:uncharacterized protein NP_5196A [Natronomonas pharaonis DSM 2160]|uniref:Uncharacterized protein n=1 Tax=Natronomonas pharaonis (strain ATCC 35678 / DSM 2160 / CIP 103997 / JCM 8858 / NBRC 14720 / NCIMB 2260 / Gabara) TaxID=348780 RepID=A0A1U7EZF5_NATPD|nr:uncharacterized protein NP_5196A [Natronomonas pharaonis DSM 2160]